MFSKRANTVPKHHFNPVKSSPPKHRCCNSSYRLRYCKKAELSHEAIGWRQTATTKLGSYYPYNRTEEDDRLSPAEEPIGFPKL